MSAFLKLGCATVATAVLFQGCKDSSNLPGSGDTITKTTWTYFDKNYSADGISFDCIGVEEYKSNWYVCDNSKAVNDYYEKNNIMLLGAVNCSFPDVHGSATFRNQVIGTGSAAQPSYDLVKNVFDGRGGFTTTPLGSSAPQLENPATAWSDTNGPTVYYKSSANGAKQEMYYDRSSKKVLNQDATST